MRMSALVSLLLLGSVGNAQENQAHPGYPPTVLLASASEEKGKVVIQLSRPVDSKAVLEALAKPKGVGVFMRSYANDPLTPPSFYRELFRERTLLLVANSGDLYNLKP